MLLNTPAAALRPRSAVRSAFRSRASITPPGRLPSSGSARQCRLYASIHDNKLHQKEKGSSNHPPWPTSAKPTPYEILGLAKGAPYNKARYFQLAKLYHPDRHQQTSHDGIPHPKKLERYRLVVDANEILSSPQKRRMYDLYGVGWDSERDAQIQHRQADRAWRQQPGNASMNATWEDWERWRHARDGTGEKQEQAFASNSAFLGIIAVFLIVGAWSQMTRAGTNSATFLELRDQQDAAISKELRERRSRRMAMDREGRIENFVRQREFEKWGHDPPGHGLPAPEGSKGLH